MVDSNRYTSFSELFDFLESRFLEAFRKGHETSWHSFYREREYLLQRLFRYGVAAAITVSWPAALLPFLLYDLSPDFGLFHFQTKPLLSPLGTLYADSKILWDITLKMAPISHEIIVICGQMLHAEATQKSGGQEG